METLTDFLAMGGYGAFVWPAFGVTAVVMVWLLISTLRRLRANERLLAQMQAASPGGERRGRGRRQAATPDAPAAGPSGKAATQ